MTSEGNVNDVQDIVSSLCDKVERFSLNSSSSGDYGIGVSESRYDAFPETDADAAAISNMSRTSNQSNLFSPVLTDNFSNDDRMSKSLPAIDTQYDNINFSTLKTLLDLILEACKKLNTLYSELDRKVADNYRFLTKLVSCRSEIY